MTFSQCVTFLLASSLMFSLGVVDPHTEPRTKDGTANRLGPTRARPKV